MVTGEEPTMAAAVTTDGLWVGIAPATDWLTVVVAFADVEQSVETTTSVW